MSESSQLERFAVSATTESPTKTTVETRDFTFTVDEPQPLGGTDAAPNPVEYLLGAWAGCLNVVAHTVAADHGIALEGVDIEIAGELDPRKFLGEAEDLRAGYQSVRAEITAHTDADEAALAAWAEAVEERCPVADNLAHPTPTDVTVKTA